MELESQKRKSSFKNVSESSILARVQYAIKHLSEAPKEKHREVFENVIQFAEIHSTKIRLGVYAAGSPEGANSNFKVSGDSSIRSSTTILIGGEGGI